MHISASTIGALKGISSLMTVVLTASRHLSLDDKVSELVLLPVVVVESGVGPGAREEFGACDLACFPSLVTSDLPV